MALLHMDGFDHYAADTDTFTTYDGGTYVIGGNGTVTIATMPVLGSLGTKGVWAGTADPDWMTYNLPAPVGTGETIGMGVHRYWDTFKGGTDSRPLGLFRFQAANGNDDFSINLTDAGYLEIRSERNGTLWATAASALTVSTLYHIEVQASLHASTGTVEVRVNGQTAVSTSGRNLLAQGDVTRVTFDSALKSTSDSGYTSYMDNLFFYDGSGSENNDWFGERTIETLFPNADTAQDDWSLSTGSDAYDLVNDAPADGGTNYLEGDAQGDQTILDMESLSTTFGSINAVCAVALMQKDSSGSSGVQFGPRTNSVSDLSDEVNPVQSSFDYFYHIVPLNPDTSAAWEAADIAGIQFDLYRST